MVAMVALAPLVGLLAVSGTSLAACAVVVLALAGVVVWMMRGRRS